MLEDLTREGLVTDHQLVAHHSVVMDPAYVHITRRPWPPAAQVAGRWPRHGVHSIGRYGGWTYCSIEDNMVEAKTLVERW